MLNTPKRKLLLRANTYMHFLPENIIYIMTYKSDGFWDFFFTYANKVLLLNGPLIVSLFYDDFFVFL